MRVEKLSFLTLLCCAALVCCATLVFYKAKAQSQSVKILKFEVDGKEVNQHFKVLLYVKGNLIEPTMVENSFIIPPDIKDCETVGVRILSGDYDLIFDPVYQSKFNTDWIVGVDKKPFDQEYVSLKEARRLKSIYYLQFVSHEGDDTRLVVKVRK